MVIIARALRFFLRMGRFAPLARGGRRGVAGGSDYRFYLLH
ncbi:hypothetical protein [Variovorax paradoxus]|nr:hypothetical protein [Variovorax paradoxus]MDP9927914.1 hypothetical protein [Variovorax paradoxus]